MVILRDKQKFIPNAMADHECILPTLLKVADRRNGLNDAGGSRKWY
jgi:hypothetical protein